MFKYNCNDYFQYLYRSSMDLELRYFRRNLIRECSHKFVLLKNGGWTSCGGFHSSDYEYEEDIVECVCCGMTNKYKDLESCLSIGMFRGIKSIESTEFDIYTRNNKIDLISNLVISSKHVPLLYRISKKMFSDEDDDKLVEVMLSLLELETDKEKVSLNTVDDAKALMERYSSSKKILVKK